MSYQIGDGFRFTLDMPPASKKNRRRWIVRGGRKFLMPSHEAMVAELAIARAARAALDRCPKFAVTDLVRLDIEHDIATDQVVVCVTKVGELPAKGKKGTKRDCHGMVETVADGLQGVMYDNDSQVDAGSWTRRRA